MMFGEDREVRRYEMSMLYFDDLCDVHTFSGLVATLYKFMRMPKSSTSSAIPFMPTRRHWGVIPAV
jgi:hypothetical protein